MSGIQNVINDPFYLYPVNQQLNYVNLFPIADLIQTTMGS